YRPSRPTWPSRHSQHLRPTRPDITLRPPVATLHPPTTTFRASTTTSGTAHQDRNRWMERKVVTDAEEVSPPVLARLCAHPATRPTAHPPTLADYVKYTSGGHPVGCPPEVCDCGWEIRAGNRARSLLLLGGLGGLFSGLGVGPDRSLLADLSISPAAPGPSRCVFGLGRCLSGLGRSPSGPCR